MINKLSLALRALLLCAAVMAARPAFAAGPIPVQVTDSAGSASGSGYGLNGLVGIDQTRLIEGEVVLGEEFTLQRLNPDTQEWEFRALGKDAYRLLVNKRLSGWRLRVRFLSLGTPLPVKGKDVSDIAFKYSTDGGTHSTEVKYDDFNKGTFTYLYLDQRADAIPFQVTATGKIGHKRTNLRLAFLNFKLKGGRVVQTKADSFEFLLKSGPVPEDLLKSCDEPTLRKLTGYIVAFNESTQDYGEHNRWEGEFDYPSAQPAASQPPVTVTRTDNGGPAARDEQEDEQEAKDLNLLWKKGRNPLNQADAGQYLVLKPPIGKTVAVAYSEYPLALARNGALPAPSTFTATAADPYLLFRLQDKAFSLSLDGKMVRFVVKGGEVRCDQG